MSIDKPNYTQVPNAILDNLDQYTPAETKILLFIARHTFGYHQARKRMSLAESWADGKGNEVKDKWKSFKPAGNPQGAVTIATLFATAKEFGYIRIV